MKRAPNEKECRALMLSRRRQQQHQQRSSSNEAARLPQPITARDRGSRKVERKDNQKKRHRQASNNFGAITPAAPEREQTITSNRIVGFSVRRSTIPSTPAVECFPTQTYSLGDVTWPNGV